MVFVGFGHKARVGGRMGMLVQQGILDAEGERHIQNVST
jgi:hypothetical protein